MSPLDQEMIGKKLAILEETIEILKDLKRKGRVEFKKTREIRDQAIYRLILGIEAITDIGNHILAEVYGRSAETYEDIIRQLGEVEIISKDLSERSKGMAKFRNVLTHLYAVIDLDKVYDNLQKAPEDFSEFAKAFSNYLKKG